MKQTVHASTITFLRGFAGSIEALLRGFIVYHIEAVSLFSTTGSLVGGAQMEKIMLNANLGTQCPEVRCISTYLPACPGYL